MLMQNNLHLLGMVAASILAVTPTDAFAQAKAGEQTPVTVNVTTAGTLNTLVTSDQKFTTTSLASRATSTEPTYCSSARWQAVTRRA